MLLANGLNLWISINTQEICQVRSASDEKSLWPGEDQRYPCLQMLTYPSTVPCRHRHSFPRSWDGKATIHPVRDQHNHTWCFLGWCCKWPQMFRSIKDFSPSFHSSFSSRRISISWNLSTLHLGSQCKFQGQVLQVRFLLTQGKEQEETSLAPACSTILPQKLTFPPPSDILPSCCSSKGGPMGRKICKSILTF